MREHGLVRRCSGHVVVIVVVPRLGGAIVAYGSSITVANLRRLRAGPVAAGTTSRHLLLHVHVVLRRLHVRMLLRLRHMVVSVMLMHLHRVVLLPRVLLLHLRVMVTMVVLQIGRLLRGWDHLMTGHLLLVHLHLLDV